MAAKRKYLPSLSIISINFQNQSLPIKYTTDKMIEINGTDTEKNKIAFHNISLTIFLRNANFIVFATNLSGITKEGS